MVKTPNKNMTNKMLSIDKHNIPFRIGKTTFIRLEGYDIIISYSASAQKVIMLRYKTEEQKFSNVPKYQL